MLAKLALGERTIGELADPLRMTFAGASKHVKVLEEAGLVSRRKAGRSHIIRLEAKPLEEAERWLRQWEKFWNVSLDRLEALIERDKKRREMAEATIEISAPIERIAPDAIRLERTLEASVETVWRYLTERSSGSSGLWVGPMQRRAASSSCSTIMTIFRQGRAISGGLRALPRGAAGTRR